MASKFRSRSIEPSSFRVKNLLQVFCEFNTAGSCSVISMIKNPSLFQLSHPDTLYRYIVDYWSVLESCSCFGLTFTTAYQKIFKLFYCEILETFLGILYDGVMAKNQINQVSKVNFDYNSFD